MIACGRQEDPARRFPAVRLSRTARWGMAAMVLGGATGCRPSPEAGASDGHRLLAAVSILPQADFVERVGGSWVRVHVLVGPGHAPSTFDPTARQLVELGRAELFFRIGLPFEDRLAAKLAEGRSGLKIIDTRAGIRLRRMGGEAGGASGQGYDPHIWLAPLLVKQQARTICDALKEADPDHATAFEENLAEFEADLEALHQKLSKRFKPLRGRPFFVFHPAFGYFADAYGLEQVAIEADGKEPGGRQLGKLIRRAKEMGIRRIFVEQGFSPRSAQAIAKATGARVVVLDPLARDYLANLEAMAGRIAEALEQASAD